MVEPAILRQLQGLNYDLHGMHDNFSKLLNASKVTVDAGDAGAANASGDVLVNVLVESLVSKASAALEKVTALNKALLVGNTDRTLYETVRGKQYKLSRVAEKHSTLFQLGVPGPMEEMQTLLNRLEAHYYQSLVPPDAADGPETIDEELADFCSQVLHTRVDPAQSALTKPPR